MAQGIKSCCPGHVHSWQPVFCPLLAGPEEVSDDPRTLGAQSGRACGGVSQTLQSPGPQLICKLVTTASGVQCLSSIILFVTMCKLTLCVCHSFCKKDKQNMS